MEIFFPFCHNNLQINPSFRKIFALTENSNKKNFLKPSVIYRVIRFIRSLVLKAQIFTTISSSNKSKRIALINIGLNCN